MASLGSLPKETSPSVGWRGVYALMDVPKGIEPSPAMLDPATKEEV
jgi:hypothetical protein